MFAPWPASDAWVRRRRRPRSICIIAYTDLLDYDAQFLTPQMSTHIITYLQDMWCVCSCLVLLHWPHLDLASKVVFNQGNLDRWQLWWISIFDFIYITHLAIVIRRSKTTENAGRKFPAPWRLFQCCTIRALDTQNIQEQAVPVKYLAQYLSALFKNAICFLFVGETR